ncbi:hypothetical protein GGI11_005916, partial [Coemansia sp. RSA 2049]
MGSIGSSGGRTRCGGAIVMVIIGRLAVLAVAAASILACAAGGRIGDSRTADDAREHRGRVIGGTDAGQGEYP